MSDQTEDARCTDWNHVWMQGCKTCVEQETEARVREEQASEELALREQTWLAALDAAMEAVVAQRAVTPNLIRRDDVLAAIDALKEDK